MNSDEYYDIPLQIARLEAALTEPDKAQLQAAIDSATTALELRQTDMMIGIVPTNDKPTKALRDLVERARARALEL
jgi:hypothetical protein